MTTDLDKLEQLACAATPGPWEAWEGCRPGMPEHERAIMRHAIHDNIVIAAPKAVSREWAFADAAFIAAARIAIPELIARVRAAEAISKAAIIVDGNEVPFDEFVLPGWFGAAGPEKPLGRITMEVRQAPTYDELAAIVRDLAASDPTYSDARRCVLCGELADNDDPLNCHQPWCVKRRAVEATKP